MAKRTKAGDEPAAGAENGPVQEALRLIAEAARLLRTDEAKQDAPGVGVFVAERLERLIDGLEGTWEARQKDSSS